MAVPVVPDAGSLEWRRRWSALLAFACLALAMKWLLIAAWGDPTPSGDQWYEEAGLFVGALRGTLGWADLLARHYEHHLLPTRLLDLLLFRVNHQVWNPLLQMTVNALLHVGALALLLAWLRPACSARQWRLLLVFATVLGCLPFDQENTLNGFQSQIYFTLLFSVACLHGLATQAPLGRRWWLALVAGMLAWLAHGAGTGTLLAGALIQGLRLWRGNRTWRDGIAALLLAGVAAAALADLPAPVDVYAVDLSSGSPHTVAISPRAASPVAFAAALLSVTAWPAPLPVPVLMLPLAAVVWRHLRDPRPVARRDAFMLALGVWWLVTGAGLAFGRASNPVASRYTDFHAVGLILEALCLLRWMGDSRPRRRLALAWLVLAMAGLDVTSAREFAGLRDITAPQSAETGRHIRAYLETGCAPCLAQTEYPQLPQIPTPAELRAMLAVPALQYALPPAIVPAHAARQPMWVSVFLGHLADLGRLLLVSGLGLALWSGALARTDIRPAMHELVRGDAP